MKQGERAVKLDEKKLTLVTHLEISKTTDCNTANSDLLVVGSLEEVITQSVVYIVAKGEREGVGEKVLVIPTPLPKKCQQKYQLSSHLISVVYFMIMPTSCNTL